MKNTVTTWTCDGCGKVETTESEDYVATLDGWIAVYRYAAGLRALWGCSPKCLAVCHEKEAKRLREPAPKPPPEPRDPYYGERQVRVKDSP